MSFEALHHAQVHSPFKGHAHGAFVVHLYVAGVVNDVHGNEFWMTTARLADAAGVGRATVVRALGELVELGVLEVVEPGGGRGNATRYRYHTQWRPGPRRQPGSAPTTTRTGSPRAGSGPETASPSDPLPPETASPGNETASRRDSSAGDTSCRKTRENKPVPASRTLAERLVRSWWESTTPRPVANFLGVVKLVERFLDAGHRPAAVAAALADAPVVTANALSFALARATNGSRASPGAGNVPLDLLTRLHDEYQETDR